jgi:hypothetical protein
LSKTRRSGSPPTPHSRSIQIERLFCFFAFCVTLENIPYVQTGYDLGVRDGVIYMVWWRCWFYDDDEIKSLSQLRSP